MVAAIAPQSNIIDADFTENKDMFSRVRLDAARYGHELWRATAESKGWVAGFPDKVADIRTGLVPFDFINRWKIKLVDEESVKDFQSIPDSHAVNFAQEIISLPNIKLNYDIKKYLISIAEGSVQPKDFTFLKKWIFELVDDWFHRNDNWGNISETILKGMTASIGSIEEASNREEMLHRIEELEKTFAKFRSKTTLAEMREELESIEAHNKSPYSMVKILVEVHRGWRVTTYKHDVPGVKVDEFHLATNNPMTAFSARKTIQNLENQLSYIIHSPKDVEVLIKNQIKIAREKYDSSYLDAAVTFGYMFKLGEELEKLLIRLERKGASKETLKLIQAKVDDLEDSIKLDANTGPLETLKDFLLNYNEEERWNTAA